MKMRFQNFAHEHAACTLRIVLPSDTAPVSSLSYPTSNCVGHVAWRAAARSGSGVSAGLLAAQFRESPSLRLPHVPIIAQYPGFTRALGLTSPALREAQEKAGLRSCSGKGSTPVYAGQSRNNPVHIGTSMLDWSLMLAVNTACENNQLMGGVGLINVFTGHLVEKFSG
eukprot:1159928-Pelagomonas_calceolata.AAC.8